MDMGNIQHVKIECDTPSMEVCEVFNTLTSQLK